jgi:pimeloyl-ACP methyl ester carboxylesterase
MTNTATRTGYAPTNGLELYYEIHGTGQPLILLHGGFGSTGMFETLLPALAADRRVIAVDLQGHGRTADIERPLRIEHMADDIAALIAYLGLATATVMGYSLGGAVALQTAIRHPELVDRLVVVSIPYKRDGWYAESLAGMDQMGAATAEPMKQTPMYEAYARVAPRPDDWATMWAKMGDLLRQEYDWSAGVAGLAMPTLLVFGDADSVSPAHAAAFFGLLGGGRRDGGWDRSGVTPHRLALLPGATHYDIFASPALVSTVASFLAEPTPAPA